MRDFGFWVRMVAIVQLFSIVLANYGDGWLAPDNPILNLHEKPAPPKPLHEIAEEARPRGAPPASISASIHDEKQLGVAGWGGSGEDKADWDAEAENDFHPYDYSEPDESEWGGDKPARDSLATGDQ